jgi:hypothetical protein
MILLSYKASKEVIERIKQFGTPPKKDKIILEPETIRKLYESTPKTEMQLLFENYEFYTSIDGFLIIKNNL